MKFLKGHTESLLHITHFTYVILFKLTKTHKGVSLSPYCRLGCRLRSAATCRISVSVSGLKPVLSDFKALDIAPPPCTPHSLWMDSVQKPSILTFAYHGF